MKNKFLLTFLFMFIFGSIDAFQTANELEKIKNSIALKLDSIYNKDTDFGGATIGVVLPEGQVLSFALGYVNEAKTIKMQPNARMLGGSTGKIFVSAAIMQLVATKKLSLDAKIMDYLGEFAWFTKIQNHESITVRHLMQHSSGISRYVYAPQFQIDIHKNADKQWTPKELLTYVFDEKPLFEAGTSFAYADTNYIILAMVLEKVAKTSMYDYVQKNVLDPFNLKTVSPQISRMIPGLVAGYNAPNDPLFPGAVLENGNYKYNVQFEWAGGGFVENATDLAKAGKLIYEGAMFSKSLLSDFFNGIEAKGLGGTWGLGVHIRNTPMGMTYGHSGFFPGYISNMLYYPDHKFAIAIQVNTSDAKKLSLYRKLFQVVSTIQRELSAIKN